MRQITCLSVSAIALGLFMATPASAQQGATSPSPAIGAQSQSATAGRSMDRLGDIKIDERQEFRGQLVRAVNPDGHPVLLIIGPENFEGDTAPEGFDRDKVRDRLQQAEFRNIEFVDNLAAVRGEIDDKAVLALSAEQGWLGAGATAQASKPETDSLKEQLGKVGLSDASEFRGKLVHARASSGQPMLVLIGPEDFAGDSSVDVSASDLSQMRDNGFQSAEVTQDISMVRGTLDDLHVIALSGPGLESDNIATGTVPGRSNIGGSSNIGSPPAGAPGAGGAGGGADAR
jgi:hypothetical protein